VQAVVVLAKRASIRMGSGLRTPGLDIQFVASANVQ
jgi:hypothetical protein